MARRKNFTNISLKLTVKGQITKFYIFNDIFRDYNGKEVRCESVWTGKKGENGPDPNKTVKKSAAVPLNVFYPPTQLEIISRDVKWNELLVAECKTFDSSNPSPKFEWRLGGRTVGKGPELEIRVEKKDDRKLLECLAVHTTFQNPSDITKTATKHIKVECKFGKNLFTVFSNLKVRGSSPD